MDTVILPQKVLDNQICSECCNYLSVGPVMVGYSSELYQGRKICGRCTNNGDTEKAYLSLYDKIAENFIFKCINHYSGCREVLAYNEAIDHEKYCMKEDLKCSYCEFEGNGCQLVHHCKEKHPEYTAENNIFPILLQPGSCNFVFVENDDLLCMKISISDNNINISNLLMAHDDNSNVKCFKLVFFSPNSSVQYVTPEVQINGNQEIFDQQESSFTLPKGPVINCFSSGKCLIEVKFLRCDRESALEQTRYLQKAIMTSMTLFKQNVANKELTHSCILNVILEFPDFVYTKGLSSLMPVVCVNCDSSVGRFDALYYCREHHIACQTCSSKNCPKCSAFSLWNKARLDRLSLKCDWGSCDENVNIIDFLSHKQNCPQRQYRCPDHNCRYAACLEDFKKHWHLTPFRQSSSIDINRRCSFASFYWLVTDYNEFLHVTIEKSSEMIIVSVNLEHAISRTTCDLKLLCFYCNRSGYIRCSHLDQQKCEYSQSGLVRTLSALIPTDRTLLLKYN